MVLITVEMTVTLALNSVSKAYSNVDVFVFGPSNSDIK